MKTIFQASLIIGIFVLVLLFNIGLVDIRIGEINYLLGKAAQSEDVSQTMGIAAKYELIKQRMATGEENLSSYELEARIQALTSGDAMEDEKAPASQKLYAVPIRAAVNGIRFLMGKPLINPREDDKVFSIIEIGYFWERNRKYNEAIQIYNQVLEKGGLTPDIKAAVLLHKAFSHSMLSQYEIAKKLYESVITVFPNSDASMLAWKLIDFIGTIENEQKRVERESSSDLDKARQYFLIMDYRNAIRHLSIFLSKTPKDSSEFEARFFKGRSHEELGEVDEAMDEYYKVIRDDGSKRWAKQANRRLLMLGEFYESKKQIAQEARKRLDAYQDMVFGDKVQQYASMVTESSLRSELASQGKAKPAARDASTDSLLGVINSIGDLDLTGEKAAEEQKAEMDKLSKELMAAGKLTDEQVHQMEQRNALAQNPYRRPWAIKQVIDENQNELQYLYNKKLRQSAKLSGKMVVRLEIKPDGKVGNAIVVQSDIADEPFQQEVLARVKQWNFKQIPEGLGSLTVNYPFEFNKDDE